MKPIAIFTHTDCEPPGYLTTLLQRLNYHFYLICLHKGEKRPSLDAFSGLVFMGGPGNVSKPESWMQQEMDIIRQAKEESIPVLGICLGAQLMSKALGGEVWQADSLEVGWHQVELLDAAASSPWFDGLGDCINVFQWHAHNFSAPPGTIEVATSECTPCQAFIDGPSLAVQFHLEMTSEIIYTLIDRFGSDLEGDSDCVQNRETILRDIDNHCEQAFRVADVLLFNWFKSLDESEQATETEYADANQYCTDNALE